MEPGFWHDRWSRGEIGFHKTEVHPFLIEYWSQVGIAPDVPVFVPLCGKSLDMLWLAGRGHPVLGVEINALACEAFFAENNLRVTRSHLGPFEKWRSGPITILQGDVFDLATADVGHIGAIYDRAAFIALPPEMRSRYVTHLTRILPKPLPQLLVTLEYDQAKRDGPPFSVTEEEVLGHFGAAYVVARLKTLDVFEPNSPWAQLGLTWLEEKVYRLSPRTTKE